MTRILITIPDDEWLLWCDTQATWQNDELFLPGDYSLANLPVNPPTIGWDRLKSLTPSDPNVKLVTLPTTVEEHFWRKFQERPYKLCEYAHATVDPDAVNGMYQGVSWWWKFVYLPADLANKRLILRFRGARQRAEVFVNEQLVGYDLVAETPFEVDITNVAQLGTENFIAVRITNHGGRHDWIDAYDLPHTPAAYWGSYLIPVSHGFGGLDAGIAIVATDDVWIEDLFFQNLATHGEAALQLTIYNQKAEPLQATLTLEVAPQSHLTGAIWSYKTQRLHLVCGENIYTYPISLPNAIRWSPENPFLYRVRATVQTASTNDEVSIRVGFRQFTAKGRGTNAHLYLNDRRIVLRSAISWNFWPNNGLFPTWEFGMRQIEAAKSIGLNMLNYHRNIANPLLLDLHDELGLLALEEPGGGMFAWEEDEFARRYMLAKIERMIRRDRNHPALVIYVVMNELVRVPPTHPYMRHVMKMIQTLDPTRIIVNQSGLSDTDATGGMMKHLAGGVAYYLPCDPNYYRDDGSGYCGWWDQHTVAGPTVWTEDFYKHPDLYMHHTKNQKEIVLWGEATPSPAPDDLAAIKVWYENHPNCTGFTYHEHLALYDSIDRYLSEKGFREAFPTVADLTRSAGNRTYDFWRRMLEQARICDAVDGLVINGWESCFYENHSGIVDLFRNHKGDSEIIRRSTRPLHLAVKSRAAVLCVGSTLLTDIYLVNELGLQGSAVLILQVNNSLGRCLRRHEFNINVSNGDVFSQLLLEEISNTVFNTPGYYHLEARLHISNQTVTGDETVFVVDWQRPQLNGSAIIVDRLGHLQKFAEERGLNIVDAVTDNASAIIVAEVSELPDLSPPSSVEAYLEMLEQLPSMAQVNTLITSDMMRRVAEGARLVLIADDSEVAKRWMQMLHDWKVIQLEGMVGPPRMVWMGGNLFARVHPLLEGLPANTVLGWEYQIDMSGSLRSWEKVSVYGPNGACIAGGQVEHIIGYMRDHQRRIGTALGIIHYGCGQIVFSMLPGLYSSLFRSPAGMHPETARKLIVNLLGWALRLAE